MSDTAPDPTSSTVLDSDPTPWQRLADADPIEVRDPLAELLGMVPEGEPLVVRFPEVAKSAGHACPAVAGAYRATQLALAELYPDELPVRSQVAVTVGGSPDDHGLGPMAAAIRQITGAADETGFKGLAGVGGRQDLLSFGDVPGDGRAFEFARTDTDEAVRVAFDPAATGVDPDEGGGQPMEMIPRIVGGEASAEERERFYQTWHDRVQSVLRAPAGPETPFSVERV
ncbi:hypothetical protein [Halostella litorea]|uniref:hypothetical protein n=1 Tax=Halostella litorea TaxID=2528831 RepID=UPI00109307A0|nr:hypothetical protein [Halostella litorea]